jgi:hypothetical protein
MWFFAHQRERVGQLRRSDLPALLLEDGLVDLEQEALHLRCVRL